jgi:hypothetical protein
MPTAFTLSGWKSTTATALIIRLPLQTFETVLPMIDAHLASIGGWIPNSTTDSTGPGFPANGFTPEQSADAIAVEQLARVHRLSATIQVTLNLEFIANLAPGQSNTDVISQMQPLISDFLESQFRNEPVDLVSVNAITGTVTPGGTLTAAQRQAVQASIAAGEIRQDPRRVAVNAARTLYNLDTTWNVDTMYTEPDQELVVIIRKYTNTNYTTLDTAATNQYVFSIGFEDFRVISGIVIPVTP